MASKKAAKPVATATEPAEMNTALLAQIVTATASAAGFMYVSDADSAPFVAQGLVEVNPNLADTNGNKAVRATQKAKDMATDPQTATAPATAPATAAKSFAIVSGVPMPDMKRAGVQRTAVYPFDELKVGDAYFMSGEGVDKPERKFASTVASARKRYAVPDPTGATRVNRKGRSVPVETFERDFAIRATTGDAFGQPGVAGAAVWRIK